jgi:ArsR family transcriptional regulator
VITALATDKPTLSASGSARVELFRLLGDEDRLRLLALCAHDELTVGELATLLHESQPNVSRKAAPLRTAGLLDARREGTRTLLRTVANDDAVLHAALDEGRALCTRDGSLARVASVVAAREEGSRKYFDEGAPDDTVALPDLALLEVIAPLLPGRALAIDVGTGEGAFLPLLSSLYERVFAVDRSAARLARCASRVAQSGLHNVRLREGDASSAQVFEDVTRAGGADLVLCARVLHHTARPADVVTACARLLKSGGHLLVVDYAAHHDETMRAHGDVWLGFAPKALLGFLHEAALEHAHVHPLTARAPSGDSDHHLGLQLAWAKKP